MKLLFAIGIILLLFCAGEYIFTRQVNIVTLSVGLFLLLLSIFKKLYQHSGDDYDGDNYTM